MVIRVGGVIVGVVGEGVLLFVAVASRTKFSLVEGNRGDSACKRNRGMKHKIKGNTEELIFRSA